MNATDFAHIRPLSEMAEIALTEEIQREVWGIGDLDIVPASLMRAVAHAGGHVLGAFLGGELAGFAFGVLSTPHGTGMVGQGLHSHMVAVRPEHRNHGLGKQLKWSQRLWCLDRGLSWMSWTFDPLQARNAKLNLRHLGVVCHDYLVDFYGAMPGSLGGGQASDRLLALWHLGAADVEAPVEQPPVEQAPVEQAPVEQTTGEQVTDEEAWLLTPEMVTEAQVFGVDSLVRAVSSRVKRALAASQAVGTHRAARKTVRVAIPTDATALLVHDPASADLWRRGVRAALLPTLAAGMCIIAFENGAYVAAQPNLIEPVL